MVKVASYSKTGSKQTEGVTLGKEVFAVEVQPNLIKQAYNAYLSNGRSAQPNVLTRGLVRGGGRKPWRQKGTGRARVGSIRVPNWRGGGVVFGPTGLENHIVQLPIKMKRLAIRQALSAQAADHRVIVIEDFSTDGKTKTTAELLKKIGVTRQTLLVVTDRSDMVDRATRNLADLTVVQSMYLNVFHVMNADSIIITKAALAEIENWLGASKPITKAETPKADANPAAKAEKTPAAKKSVAKKPSTKAQAKGEDK